jgi:hypothetical protein
MDILSGVNVPVGEANPRTKRRVRNLIERHGLPVTRKGKLISSRRSWLDRWYGEPDQPGDGRGE